MVQAVMEDARAAVQAGMDAIALEPRLAPRVAAAALKRQPPVLPVLVGQLPDASADLLEVFAAGRVIVAAVELVASDRPTRRRRSGPIDIGLAGEGTCPTESQVAHPKVVEAGLEAIRASSLPYVFARPLLLPLPPLLLLLLPLLLLLAPLPLLL